MWKYCGFWREKKVEKKQTIFPVEIVGISTRFPRVFHKEHQPRIFLISSLSSTSKFFTVLILIFTFSSLDIMVE